MQTESDRAVDGVWCRRRGCVGVWLWSQGFVEGCEWSHGVGDLGEARRGCGWTGERSVRVEAACRRLGRYHGYKGPSLLDAIDSLQPPARDYSKPIVMPICDVIKLQPQGQVSACGKLEAGALQTGSKVQNPLVVLGC
ncbi:translation elongation factor EF1A/initiation factor IF2gamma family protein [Actinidia rufa]|uniref:Translation elongation factor EF1A/initiation factor IF2gamma family protein n=1 Tax=Actinidia rufa TaxID=165716 RepID=A0A7J0FDB5_9ERIC|nr:translation elongation factor EF1A/initiation factor IF2gamma family protein [Actinidia rufa]